VSGDVPQPSLTERQRAILRLIVQEYSGTGLPVGSKSLTERYGLGLSSATIRNEMAELEHNGLVQHLHTSGGRIPTVEGYRYFVRHLMGQPSLPSEAQIMIRHQFQQPQMQLKAGSIWRHRYWRLLRGMFPLSPCPERCNRASGTSN